MNKKYFAIPALALLAAALYLTPEKEAPLKQSVKLAPAESARTTRPRTASRPAKPVATTQKHNRVAPAVRQSASAPHLQLQAPMPATSAELLEERQRLVSEGYGKFPAIDLSKMNKHKEATLEAFSDPQRFSGRISIVGKRQKFDLARYQKNPSYYLDITEPGRAFDAAQAGEGFSRLERLSPAFLDTVQGEAVAISVRGEKSMPISLTAFDGGQFDNGLSSITVKADSSGFASVNFLPTTGVIADCRIRAASPTSTGTLGFVVSVTLPKKTENK
ncbi:MAG: hypothetical protein HRT88_16240 [Lentisphaeraceae bacterium]|nr:hypothetical protein [Lentisphaeraceae bacterium]